MGTFYSSFNRSRRIRFESLENRYMMAVIPGDYDRSGLVDQVDYTEWRSNFGAIGEALADGNGNSVVDAADYVVWRKNLGKTVDDVPPDAPIGVSAAVAGPTSVNLSWQSVAGADSYRVERRRPNVTNDPFTVVAPTVTATNFSDTTVVTGTVYEYRIIAQNEAGQSMPSATASVTAGSANITAYRPQQLHDPENPTNAPIYFPFAKTPVAEQDENSTTVGAGIRQNRDDDNDNEIIDRFEGGIAIPLENDLIEVRVDRLPGQGNLVIRAGDDLQLYYTYDKEEPVPLDDDAIFTENLPFANNMVTVFVEWVTNGHGTDMIELVDPVTMMVIDTIMFHTFTSLTMVMGGFQQVPSVPTDPEHGMFLLADRLYAQGYDVMKWDEFEVDTEGFGVVYDEIQNAVNNRSQTDIALIGFSYGGGAVYNLSSLMDEENTFGGLDAYDLEFTAYVDGLQQATTNAEVRLPVNTM